MAYVHNLANIISVWCNDCFCQFGNDKCLSNHMQYCDGTALSKFSNKLNNHYASKGLTGQKHDMHKHGIEMTFS